jgi:predicted dehydrogenase
MRVAIIGCGLIGRKRALALGPDDTLVACCDTNGESAGAIAGEFSCRPFTDHRALFASEKPDAVVVAVVNKFTRGIVLDALAGRSHVLAEKPLGRNAGEARDMVDAAAAAGRVLKVGFNHRFHPAVWKAGRSSTRVASARCSPSVRATATAAGPAWSGNGGPRPTCAAAASFSTRAST